MTFSSDSIFFLGMPTLFKGLVVSLDSFLSLSNTSFPLNLLGVQNSVILVNLFNGVSLGRVSSIACVIFHC